MDNLKPPFFILFVILITLFSSCNPEEPEPEPSFTSLDSLRIQISSPQDGSIMMPGESVKFIGYLFGEPEKEESSLRAEWTSSVDGLLKESAINPNDYVSFELDNLSRNIHEISFKVFNEIDSVVEEKVTIFNLSKLDTLNRTDKSITFSWDKVSINSFAGYEFYRSRNTYSLDFDDPIYTTTNPNDTVFVDSTARVGREYYYQVRILLDDRDHVPTNIISAEPGFFNYLDFPLLKIEVDQERQVVYGLVAPKDLDDNLEDGYGITLIDGDNLEVQQRILTSERFVDFTISADNQFLYAATRNTIHKIALDGFNEVSTISVYEPIDKIEVGSNNRLYYKIYPGRYCSCSSEFRIVDLENEYVLAYNTEIAPAYSSYFWGEFTIDAETNTIYHVEHLSSATIYKFSTANDTFSNQVRKIGTGILTNFIFFRNGKLFWHHIIMNSELEWIGVFQNEGREAVIMDVSPDGQLAFGYEGFFNVDDQSFIKEIPIPRDDAKFIENRKLIIVSSDYDGLRSTLYRYSF
ncbi:hypothetical protein [Marivirga sp.]|uniref:hypothetical protein n=1 Tax=Marivirga sp. TaxID=2018662 RepID=UPI002D7F61DA|nr:hypothetical protein [Marivirga sp.]HET8861424.1 hypothetical protein [Marivirga sp.]